MLPVVLNGPTRLLALACDDVRKHGIERFGTRVSRICNYKMIAGDETRYYTFYLAEDGQVAFYQSSTE